ncbi:MAG: CapA family protein [Dorea sp.]|jgi:hypothetical protein|nr:CapA family protein [Dorea sp.]
MYEEKNSREDRIRSQRSRQGRPNSIRDAKRKRERRRRILKIRITLCASFLVCACFLLVWGIRAVISAVSKAPKAESKADAGRDSGKAKDKIDTSMVQIEEVTLGADAKVNEGEAVTLTVSSMGDCTLGTDVNFDYSTSLNAYYDAQGPDYFFQNVRSVLAADDLSIVNMEGTLTTSDQRQDKRFAFKAPPEYAAILSGSSVEAANMANNHSRDYGDSSYTDTIAALENAGIPTFGFERAKLLKIKGVKVGVTGVYELADHLEKQQQVKENIAALKEAGAKLIIINFHWGNEREYTPTDIQKTLAHLAIDEGADLVIGHHPHVLQGIERYKDKYIAYSLGNFCFGGNSNPEDKDSLIFQQTFTIEDGKVKKDDNITLIPCSLSSASDHNDYCPTILDGDAKQRVLNKIEQYSQW